MKKTILLITGTLIMGLAVIAQTNKNQGTPTSLSQSGNAKNTTKEKDKDFIMKAANGGMMEVELGQLAAKNAASSEVKEFGLLMVKDHSDANTKLKGVIARSQMNMPQKLEKEQQDKVDKLKKLTGKEFDKEYMDLMVKDHKDDIKEFEKAQNNVSDSDLKNWISSTLPVLRRHLDRAEAVRKKVNENK